MEVGLLVVVAVLLALLLGTLWTVFYQLLRQQGRILLRLEQLEQVLTFAGQGAMPGMPAATAGLEVGAEVAPFLLPDLSEREVGLEDYRGRRVLLVNWNPHCGYCDMIAPDLAELQPGLEKQNVHLLLLAQGDAEANRKQVEEHGLECPILLQTESRSTDVFGNLGTPAAYLLDEQGRVAAPLAIGANDVPALARDAAAPEGDGKHLPGQRPLSESRIERNGLLAGTPAPDFELRDLAGQPISLERYRGRKLLLVFSDPHCGPCDQLAPQLNRLGIEVLMVGRGDPEENRRKAAEHGLEFPVVLQRKWELSRKYAIFDTPVAFLINEEGVIARNVARGVEEILALAREGSGPEAKELQDGRALR